MKSWGLLVTAAGLAGVCLGLPILGAWAGGISISSRFRFPPPPEFRDYPGFSIWAFSCLFAGGCLVVVAWFAARRKSALPPIPTGPIRRHRIPLWGWMAMFATFSAWILAWNRFEWFAPFQAFTFTPLWLGYILVVNAFIYTRTGSCPLIDSTSRYLSLFPLSSVFWWFFEYLNRFVGNWVYFGVEEFGPFQYALHATICFSTVLPAVYATYEFLRTLQPLQSFLASGPPIRLAYKFEFALCAAAAVAAVFFLIGLYPHLLFPLLWCGPLLGWLSLNAISAHTVSLRGLEAGDWRYTMSWVLAALICGFFWEMWNFHSFAKWVYNIPYFQGFPLFEMPLAGYSGYLPFGLQCALVVRIVFRRV